MIKKKEDDENGNLIIDYRKGDEIQSAWADAIEEVKLMFDESILKIYKTSSSIYTEIILKHESLLVCFSKYVAYLMICNFKWLIHKYQTSFQLIDNKKSEKALIIALIREINHSTNLLRSDLFEAYCT